MRTKGNMSVHTKQILASLFGVVLCAGAPAPSPNAPTAAQSSICRPEFRVGDAQYSAGTSFLLKVDGADHPLLVTATHLFGPDGGLDAQIPWNELPSKAQMVKCTTYGSGETWHADAPLAIPGAHPGVDETAMLDVAAFPFSGSTTQPALRLASRQPAVGDSVWLVSEIIAEPKQAGLLHHAVVAEITKSYLLIVYDHPLGATATSGAPIVDARGDVVGVNFGGGVSKGRMLGVATSGAALTKALSAKH